MNEELKVWRGDDAFDLPDDADQQASTAVAKAAEALAGLHPSIQGLVLAMLTAKWLAGFLQPEKMRATSWEAFRDFVEQTLPDEITLMEALLSESQAHRTETTH